MKKNEVVATKAVATKAQTKAVANIDKKDQILSLVQVQEMLQKATTGSKCKVFTDSKYYVGFGVKANGFSVNVKKTKYNIFCNDTAYEVVEGMKLEGCTCTKGGNSADRTRPNSVECKSTESLLKMVAQILGTIYKPATDTN